MSQLRALLVGAGGMGRAWAKNVLANPDVALVGWVDLRRDVLEEAAHALEPSGVVLESDLQRAMATARPDVVIDVTSPEAHHAVTLTALVAGLPVLGEKPMAHTLEHAREMVAASERSGTLYMVSQSRRYDARLFALRRLAEQELGAPGILTSDFFLGPHFGGFREAMAHPLLLDMAIHTFDAARFITGADPVAVYCDAWNPPWSWYDGAACATAMFEMTGGLRYTYRGSWCSEGRPTSWEAAWRVVGPRGTATWDGDNAPIAEVVVGDDGFLRQTEPRTVAVDASMPTGIAGSLRDFVHAVRSGSTPMGECHDNIKPRKPVSMHSGPSNPVICKYRPSSRHSSCTRILNRSISSRRFSNLS